jgi:hypothetical protein
MTAAALAPSGGSEIANSSTIPFEEALLRSRSLTSPVSARRFERQRAQPSASRDYENPSMAFSHGLPDRLLSSSLRGAGRPANG